MKILAKITAASIALLAFSANLAHADSTTLTSNVNADNGFREYISLSATDLTGAILINSGNDWGVTNSSTSTAGLFTGGTEYLIVEAINWGGPGAFLGDFSLSGTGYQFANGTQSLLTGDSAWSVTTNTFANFTAQNSMYTTNISGAYVATTSEGTNGVGPWGYRNGVNGAAQWISDATNGYGSNGYGYTENIFVTAITSTSNVPEPTSIALLAIGLLGFAASHRKNNQV